MRLIGVVVRCCSYVVGLVLAIAAGGVIEATLARASSSAPPGGPWCWHYVNSLDEAFLLKLRTLQLGPASFIVSGILAGEEGQFPIFGNAELINDRIRSNLTLNDASPSIPSTFLSAVQFAVTVDPQTLNGQFEWLSPTLSGPADGPREFQAYSLHGTLTFLNSGDECAQMSTVPEK